MRTIRKGYYIFVANDPRVPMETQEEFKKWGLAKYEFTDNDNWPHQIYVREAPQIMANM
jgi:hypothetical protein